MLTKKNIRIAPVSQLTYTYNKRLHCRAFSFIMDLSVIRKQCYKKELLPLFVVLQFTRKHRNWYFNFISIRPSTNIRYSNDTKMHDHSWFIFFYITQTCHIVMSVLRINNLKLVRVSEILSNLNDSVNHWENCDVL